jgi:hypothetical protein
MTRGSRARRPADASDPPINGPSGPVLERLFSEKGLRPGTWWPFLVQGEGKQLPFGIESQSGFVLSRDGRVFAWWLDATSGGAPVLDRWRLVDDPEHAFARDPEYRAARIKLRRTRARP